MERFKRWSVYTPAILVCLQPRLLNCHGVAPVLSSRPPYGQEAAKCPEPLCPTSVLPPLGRCECHLLRGRYPSVIAPTGSCATPVGLSPASAFSLVRRVFAGCTQSLLPTGASRRYLRESFLGCWIPCPGGTPCALTCFFHGIIGLPHGKIGSAFRVCPANYDFSQGGFRGCRYSLMFRPPSLLAPQIVPTAAPTTARQPGLLRPGLSCFVTSARTGYASRPNTGN